MLFSDIASTSEEKGLRSYVPNVFSRSKLIYLLRLVLIREKKPATGSLAVDVVLRNPVPGPVSRPFF